MNHRQQQTRQMLGKKVHIRIDRPVGYLHKGMVYSVNYGYIPGLIAGDGEEQDVYLLGIPTPVSEFDGVVIAAVLRNDDVEDKLIAAPEGMTFTRDQITQAVHFVEQFFDSTIILA